MDGGTVTREGAETLLVILGAGASSDCLPADVPAYKPVSAEGVATLPLDLVRPPLTQGLVQAQPFVNRLASRWPGARPVLDVLRRRLRASRGSPAAEAVSLEQALAEYEQRQRNVPEVEEHLLAFRFYLRDLFWESAHYMGSPDLMGGITNYQGLVNRVLEWCGLRSATACIVSFNYDLLLEEALRSTWGFQIGDIASYLGHRCVAVVKPHGSVQWAWPTKGGGIHASDPAGFGAVSILHALRAGIDKASMRSFSEPPYKAEEGLIPALALPIRDKSTFVWPPEQAKYFASLQGAVSRVLVVGWRALEPHFLPYLKPLVRVDSRVLVVTEKPSAAQATVDQLRPYLDARADAWRTSVSGFRLALESPELDWLLDL